MNKNNKTDKKIISVKVPNQGKSMKKKRKKLMLSKNIKVKNLKFIFALVSLFFIIFGGLILIDFVLQSQTKVQISTEYALLEPKSKNSDRILISSPSQVKDHENPINGVMMTKLDYDELIAKHPVAITVNNHKAARPQHGLSQADVVGEFLAEGGITRYVPIFFQNRDVPKIGPVRSLRYYMIMFASEFAEPVILHEGQAGYDDAPWETYREKADARGAIYRFGIKSLQSAGSRYRDKEKARSSGYVHSLYTDFNLINEELDRLSGVWSYGAESIEPLNFKYDAPLEERGDFKSYSIKFLSLLSKDYMSGFEYDKDSNTYKRFISGEPDIDQVTGQQIAPKNVVIEWHNYQDANDGHARIIIDMIGEDKVIVLRDGKVIEGKWVKESRTSRTKYYDNSGNPIELNRGQIWNVYAVKVGDRLVSDLEINYVYDNAN